MTKVLVISGTGTIGAPMVRRLAAQPGPEVAELTSFEGWLRTTGWTAGACEQRRAAGHPARRKAPARLGPIDRPARP